MYKYETHFHTAPVSKCASSTVEEMLNFYKANDFTGVFITNHFIDGNINIDFNTPYEEKINFYFSDYEKALTYGKQIGLDVFLGIECSYKGTDFLVFGLDKAWFLSHSFITTMTKRQQLEYYRENGALVFQAHPFREAQYIDHIRLFPRSVDGVEVINAQRTDFENEMAKEYAKNYNFLSLAGSDNHNCNTTTNLAGIKTFDKILSVDDFISKIKNGRYEIFKETINK